MCFAPQQRAIFPDRNFQNGSGNEVFCTFWRTNVLRATAACHFSGSQLPKWLRHEVFCTFWRKNVLRATAACNFSFLNSTATSAPAALARLLFEHQEARIIEKTQLFATLLTFRACWTACEWLYTHVDLLASDLTDVDLLASDMTAVRLCFSTLHIVGS